ncbi:hypothetical protein KIP88_38625 [Bradyrhizobium sp. SRL28]|nr:hypothetical protein [Bradyrhizobium sp. SRL28]
MVFRTAIGQKTSSEHWVSSFLKQRSAQVTWASVASIFFWQPRTASFFRFGCLYDKRNLPELIVYQYQREANPPYPWGILMPVSGRLKPEII